MILLWTTAACNIAGLSSKRCLQGLLVAHELRSALFVGLPQPPVAKVLEALTHRSCHDAFDSERYELLGDAVLKHAASRQVFWHSLGDGKEPAEGLREGDLTEAVSRLVSNGTLFRLAHVRPSPGAALLRIVRLSAKRVIPRRSRVKPFHLRRRGTTALQDHCYH